jgi:hypothetical protein
VVSHIIDRSTDESEAQEPQWTRTTNKHEEASTLMLTDFRQKARKVELRMEELANGKLKDGLAVRRSKAEPQYAKP